MAGRMRGTEQRVEVGREEGGGQADVRVQRLEARAQIHYEGHEDTKAEGFRGSRIPGVLWSGEDGWGTRRRVPAADS